MSISSDFSLRLHCGVNRGRKYNETYRTAPDLLSHYFKSSSMIALFNRSAIHIFMSARLLRSTYTITLREFNKRWGERLR